MRIFAPAGDVVGAGPADEERSSFLHEASAIKEIAHNEMTRRSRIGFSFSPRGGDAQADLGRESGELDGNDQQRTGYGELVLRGHVRKSHAAADDTQKQQCEHGPEDASAPAEDV